MNISVYKNLGLSIGKNHPIELFLLITALALTLFSVLSVRSPEKNVEQPSIQNQPEVLAAEDQAASEDRTIAIDLSGAILRPDIYEVTEGARLGDVIDHAGGLSDEAATTFIARNFNMAKFVTDQEKIYIPTLKDIENGTFTEHTRILDYLLPIASVTTPSEKKKQSADLSISINEATADELDMLPGVGPTTAQKIIQNRPYGAIEELLEKKIVKASAFEEIKELITL